MSSSPGSSELRFRRSLELDRLCDRFEDELRRAKEPKIEAFLAQVPEPERQYLLRELLKLEIAWQGRTDDESRRRFEERFPDSKGIVAEVFVGARTKGDGTGRGEPEPPGDRTETRPGRFRIIRYHSHGGLATVYIALDEDLDREVALKQIMPHLAPDETSRRRFEFEAKLTGRLEHPGVAPVYAAGYRADGTPFFVTKLIRGQSLTDATAELHATAPWDRPGRAPRLALRRLLRHLLAVCETVDYAHSVGILHRDLKPDHVLLGAYGETVLIDWGLAKPLPVGGDRGSEVGPDGNERTWSASLREWDRGDSTAEGTIVGTPIYASPEQLRGDEEEIGPASDVYGLGVTLYQLITGRPPYDPALPPLELRAAVSAGAAPPPRRLHRGIPRPLEAICCCAMAVRPEQRYPTVRALAEDLERWLAGEPVSAHAERLHELIARWCRRHRVWTGIAAALLVLGTSAWLAWSMRSSLARARIEPIVRQIESAELERIPDLAELLHPDASEARPVLVRAMKAPLTAKSRRNLAMARLGIDPSAAPEVARELESDDPFRQRVVAALVSHQGVSAAALARLLAPVRDRLIDDLCAHLLGGPGGPLAEAACNILIDYAADRPDVLARCLAVPDDARFAIILGLLRRRQNEAIPALRRTMAEIVDYSPYRPVETAWASLGSATIRVVEGAGGMVHPSFALCQSMPLADYLKAVKELQPAGYRPHRFRPFRAQDGEIEVAALWARDGARFVLACEVDAAEVRRLDTAHAARGLSAIDIAVYAGNVQSDIRYAAIWIDPDVTALRHARERARTVAQFTWCETPPSGGRLAVGLDLAGARADDEDTEGLRTWAPVTQGVARPDGSPVLAQVRVPLHGPEKPFAFSIGTADDLPDRLAHGLAQGDVGLASSDHGGEPKFVGTWREPAHFATNLIHDRDEDAHRSRAMELTRGGYLPESIAATAGPGATTTVASVWRKVVPGRQDDRDAVHRVRLAVALLHLGDAGPTWAMLRSGPDPTERSWLVELLPRLRIPPEILGRQFDVEKDPSARQALLLALGGYQPTPAVVEAMVPNLLKLVRTEPHPGVRAAAEWVLRSSGWDQEVEAALGVVGQEGLRAVSGRSWFLDKENHLFVAIRGPAEFAMGAPAWDMTDERVLLTHRALIPRDFAIAATEVTAAQFHRFREAMRRRGIPIRGNEQTSFSRDPRGPALEVTIVDAARYCNWLSGQSGISRDQWCFEEQDGQVRLANGYLSRTGYRLPTEAEWEFACRAGSTTIRPFGRGRGDAYELLTRYAWCLENARNRAHPVGSLRPNDLGLFDMLGNAHEWCLDAKLPYCRGECDRPRIDEQVPGTIAGDGNRILRGGWFHYPVNGLTSEARSWNWAAYPHYQMGFRLARTLAVGG